MDMAFCGRRRRLPKAIESLEKALKKEPTFLPILRNLGEAYQLRGQDGKAIAVFEKALKRMTRTV